MTTPSTVKLSKTYESIFHRPYLRFVNPMVFELKYYSQCKSCRFCQDWCCSFGIDIFLLERKKLLSKQRELGKLTGISSKRWFTKKENQEKEYPGNKKYVRTRVINGKCVFYDSNNRGCLLHKYCLDYNLDYHQLKPMLCCLFPLDFYGYILGPAFEVRKNTLVCLNTGISLYSGVRQELEYYFGEKLVNELDKVKRRFS